MSEQPQERRQYPRYEVEGVQGIAHFTSDLRVVDLSIGGAAVESTVPLTTGQIHELTLQRDGQSATLEVVVRWSRLARAASSAQGGSLPIYRSGLEFKGVLADSAEELLHVIRDSENGQESRERLFGRFEPDTTTAARLDAHCNIRVRRISRSGMLVEVGYFPRLGTRFQVEVPTNSGSPLSAQVRVAYTRPIRGDLGAVAEVGLQFLALDSPTEQVLDHWISAIE